MGNFVVGSCQIASSLFANVDRCTDINILIAAYLIMRNIYHCRTCTCIWTKSGAWTKQERQRMCGWLYEIYMNDSESVVDCMNLQLSISSEQIWLSIGKYVKSILHIAWTVNLYQSWKKNFFELRLTIHWSIQCNSRSAKFQHFYVEQHYKHVHKYIIPQFVCIILQGGRHGIKPAYYNHKLHPWYNNKNSYNNKYSICL